MFEKLSIAVPVVEAVGILKDIVVAPGVTTPPPYPIFDVPPTPMVTFCVVLNSHPAGRVRVCPQAAISPGAFSVIVGPPIVPSVVQVAVPPDEVVSIEMFVPPVAGVMLLAALARGIKSRNPEKDCVTNIVARTIFATIFLGLILHVKVIIRNE